MSVYKRVYADVPVEADKKLSKMAIDSGLSKKAFLEKLIMEAKPKSKVSRKRKS